MKLTRRIDMKEFVLNAVHLRGRARTALVAMLALVTGFGFLPTRSAKGFTHPTPQSNCPRVQSLQTITQILASNGLVLERATSSSQASLTFTLSANNDFSTTPPCTNAPDEVFIQISECTNISSVFIGAPTEEPCGSVVLPSAVDTITYTNPALPATITFNVRCEGNVCKNAPAGYPTTTNPVFRKGTLSLPALTAIEGSSSVSSVDDSQDVNN
jgi:hypothetical protein